MRWKPVLTDPRLPIWRSSPLLLQQFDQKVSLSGGEILEMNAETDLKNVISHFSNELDLHSVVERNEYFDNFIVIDIAGAKHETAVQAHIADSPGQAARR